MRTLSFSEDDSTLGQIVRRQFNSHLITRNNTDEVFTHTARNMSHHFATGLQLDTETSIGECLGYSTFDFEGLFFLCQVTKPVSFEGNSLEFKQQKVALVPSANSSIRHRTAITNDHHSRKNHQQRTN
ncbi:hypothetical protein Rcae01_04734 [Novipirellula caenicola]|uniref:Uncharacterized protein n=1 Tax=Novipirellula caenicola TaxID=1536901 RepID=A0ABP9VVR4_9BACT